MVNAVGPVFTGAFEEFVINADNGEQYKIHYSPDRNNQALQEAGLPPSYYWMPGAVRLAQKGDTGDYKFHQIHYVGVFDEDTNIGLGSGETQGGILTLTATSSYPTAVLKQAEEQLLAKFRGNNDKYWGWRSPVAPRFAITPIIGNVTSVTNLTGLEGTFVPTGGGGGGGGNGTGAPRLVGPAPVRLVNPRIVPHGRDFRAPTVAEPWGFRLQGQGPGSVTGGENAFSAMMGPLASETIWAGFHGASSPINIYMDLQIQMWSQLMRVKITGNWDRVFEHFSAAAQGRYLWFSADIKAEFNNMRMSGGIRVEVDIDGTAPGAAEMERAINQRIDTIVAQFTEIAKKVIFEPPQPQVEAAQASSGGGLLSGLLGYGGGLALKYRRDSTSLDLFYEETRYFRYIQPNRISSSMQGFFDVIKNDPQAERKYFTRLVLGQLGRKVTRFVKPVANYPDPSKGWVGDPIAFLSAQVGYPDPNGVIVWKAQPFQRTDPPEANFAPAWVMLRDGELQNPPQGWSPDKTFLKRRVHLLEPPGEAENPYMRVQVENNVIELDEGPNGSLGNDKIIEVRADRTGFLEVGPTVLSAMLSSEAEMVEVEFRAKDRRNDGTDRSGSTVRFRWSFNDQNESRYWRLFTGQKDYVPRYDYRVHVTVRGTLFNRGMAWSGPWVIDAAGSGPIIIDVPAPGAAGVVMRRLTPREIVSRDIVHVEAPVTPGIGTPPRETETSGVAAGPGAPGGGGGLGAPRSGRSAPGDSQDLSLSFVPVPAEAAERSPAPQSRESGGAAYEQEMEARATRARGAATSRSGGKGGTARSSREESVGYDEAGDFGAPDDAWMSVPVERPA